MATTDKNYDAIIVGGGHNGLVNGAYLAKAGLKVLIVERRHLVGGAAITEELRPGFHFTTFSYALSLLRPDIVQELDLVKHGFMPILMPSSFAPMENGDYLLLGQDRDENIKEIMRHSPHDADAMDRYEYDIERVCQVVKPLFDKVPPNIFGKSPEDLAETAELVRHLARRRARRSCTTWSGCSPAAPPTSSTTTSRATSSRATSRRPASSAPRSARCRRAPGWCCSTTRWASTTATSASWSFHKGGNGGFTQVLARAAQAFGAEIMLDAPVDIGDHQERRGGRRRARGRHRAHRQRPSSARSTRGVPSPSSSSRASCPATWSRTSTGSEFQGTSAKVNFALDGAPRYPALGDRTDQYRGFINIGPSMEYLERAFDDAKYGWYSQRPYIDCAIQSFVDPDMAPPGKHVMSCFVQYAPYHLKGSDWDTERENFGDTVQAHARVVLPRLRRPRAAARGRRRRSTSSAVVGLTEGNIFAGEFFAPQMYFFRPAPGWSQYRTPIDGYYQCGSGTHPGGCVMGAPGKLASQQILRDLKNRGDGSV